MSRCAICRSGSVEMGYAIVRRSPRCSPGWKNTCGKLRSMAIADIDARDTREIAASFDLTKLPPDFYADPYPYYRALREHEPVKRMPDGSCFLTRYDDLLTAYKNTRLFSSDKKKEFAPKYGSSLLYEHHTTSLVFNDPPAHTRERRVIMGALSPRAIAEMEPYLIALVGRLLDDLAARHHVDLID